MKELYIARKDVLCVCVCVCEKKKKASIEENRAQHTHNIVGIFEKKSLSLPLWVSLCVCVCLRLPREYGPCGFSPLPRSCRLSSSLLLCLFSTQYKHKTKPTFARIYIRKGSECFLCVFVFSECLCVCMCVCLEKGILEHQTLLPRSSAGQFHRCKIRKNRRNSHLPHTYTRPRTLCTKRHSLPAK